MELIQTKDYLLLVDEEAEIKEDDYFLLDDKYIYKGGGDMANDTAKKIIAYRKLNEEAEELDLPLLPPFEEDKEMFLLAGEFARTGGWQCPDSFIAGYKAAQSKQLELLKKAIQLASDAENIEEVEEEIIQSLSTQQLPKDFILSDKFSNFEENLKNGEYKW